MRKLLVLLVVLAIAPIASAAQVWSLSGNSGPGAMDVLAGDVIVATLDLSGGDTSIGLNIGAITDQGAGGSMDDSDINAGFTTGRETGMTETEFQAKYSMASGIAASAAIWLAGTDTGGGTYSSDIITLDYTVSSTAVNGSTVTIKAVPFAAIGILSSTININGSDVAMCDLVLNVVPEPITIALLGLGGLFLRHRK